MDDLYNSDEVEIGTTLKLCYGGSSFEMVKEIISGIHQLFNGIEKNDKVIPLSFRPLRL